MDALNKSRARMYVCYSALGPRVQYNKLFKPTYLPARVRDNQFFYYCALFLLARNWYHQVSHRHS